MENNLRQAILNNDMNEYYPIYNEAHGYYHPHAAVRTHNKYEMEIPRPVNERAEFIERYQGHKFPPCSQVQNGLDDRHMAVNLKTDNENKELFDPRVIPHYSGENERKKLHHHMYNQEKAHTSAIPNWIGAGESKERFGSRVIPHYSHETERKKLNQHVYAQEKSSSSEIPNKTDEDENKERFGSRVIPHYSHENERKKIHQHMYDQEKSPTSEISNRTEEDENKECFGSSPISQVSQENESKKLYQHMYGQEKAYTSKLSNRTADDSHRADSLTTDNDNKERIGLKVNPEYSAKNESKKMHQHMYDQEKTNTSVVPNRKDDDETEDVNDTDDEQSDNSQGQHISNFMEVKLEVGNKSLIVQDNISNQYLPKEELPSPETKTPHPMHDDSYYVKNNEGRYACISCGSLYNSHYGVWNHFKTTTCGIGTKEKSSTRKDWSSMYTKEANGSFTCNKCGAMYNSMHGIYSHLKTTVCGGGHKEKGKARIDWTSLYRKVDESLIVCLNCKSEFVDMHGIHAHLKKTECGANAKVKEFVPKEAAIPLTETPEKKKFKDLFTKNGEVFVCNKCSTEYQSANSVRLHLSKTTCGYGNKEYSPAPRKNFKGLYTKDGDIVICNACGGKYQSVNGVHCHLTQTVCGFGSKGAPTPKKDYQYMYTKEGDNVFCNNCNAKYTSIFGVHHHLNTTTCGFGTKNPVRVTKPRNNILYLKTEDNNLSCYACEKTYSQLNGLKYHLKKTPACAEALGVDAKHLKVSGTRKRKRDKKENLPDANDHEDNDEPDQTVFSDTDCHDPSQYVDTELEEPTHNDKSEVEEQTMNCDSQVEEPLNNLNSDLEENTVDYVKEPSNNLNSEAGNHITDWDSKQEETSDDDDN